MSKRQHFAQDTWLDPEEYAYPSGSLRQSRRKFKAVMNATAKEYVTGVAGIPATYSTIPARGKFHGRTVHGYLSIGSEWGTAAGVLIFHIPTPKLRLGYGENPGAGGAKMPQLFTYEDAAELLGNRDERDLGANTVIYRERGDGSIRIRLYATDIITWYLEGGICLRTGGHNTVTTRGRMNAILSPFIRVSSRGGRAVAVTHGVTIPFEDGKAEISDRDITGREYGENPFMQRQVFQNDGWEIEFDGGESVASPDFNAPDIDELRKIIGTNRKVHIGDAYGRVEAVTYLPKNTWWGRLSAPGYLDATEYVYGNTRREVEEMLSDLYGDDGEENDE